MVSWDTTAQFVLILKIFHERGARPQGDYVHGCRRICPSRLRLLDRLGYELADGAQRSAHSTEGTDFHMLQEELIDLSTGEKGASLTKIALNGDDSFIVERSRGSQRPPSH